MTDVAPALVATPAPASPPSAVTDLALTPAQEARGQIEQLKQNPDWVKKYLDGDAATVRQLTELQLREHAHRDPTPLIGGPTLQMQAHETALDLEARTDLPPEVIAQVRDRLPVSETEYRLAANKKAALFADPFWRTAYFQGGAEEKSELLLLQIILSSPIKPGK